MATFDAAAVHRSRRPPSRASKGDGYPRNDPHRFRIQMDGPYDLVLSMFALAIAAVMLVAGELHLVTRSDPQTVTPPPSVLTSSTD
jgi:hypothetical protein